MPKLFRAVIWVLIAFAAAGALAHVALTRGETVSAAWLLTAAVCSYAIAYRFYSKFIAAKIFALDANRTTPAVRLNDGHDYVPTNRWIVFGHHFAAIAGPGPLVGPTLAAQFGYLPGVIWIIVGVCLGGAVQDFVIPRVVRSAATENRSARWRAKRSDRSRERQALVAVVGIMVVLLACSASWSSIALKSSPWGTVTIGLTIPIALLMGVYLRWIRPGRVLEASAMGLIALVASLYIGRWASKVPTVATMFTLVGTDARRSRS
jgi:carbon starvation protein